MSRVSKTPIVMKLKNSNFDSTLNPKLWQPQVVTKLKLWQNWNFDKSQVVTKLKLWQNSNFEENTKKTQNVTQTQIVTELENSIYNKI